MSSKEISQALADVSAMVELLARRPLLTISDLAVRYRVDCHTITRWHRAGHLPAPKRIRRNLYWSAMTITEWEMRTVKGRKAAAKGGFA